MADGFGGWNERAQRFFIGLELDNSKKYFEANRKIYETEVKGPMVALLDSLEPEFGTPKVARPNRDIRFSKDKSPYKTNIYGHNPNGYVALDARGLTSAAGRYELDPTALTRYREKAAASSSGGQLQDIVQTVEDKGYQVGGEELKRVPSPYPQDHPRARLLRHKRLYMWKTFGLEPWLGTPEARDRITVVWRDAAPLEAWFRKHVD